MTPATQRQWHCRPEADADVSAVRGINLSAFPTSEEADLVDALRHDHAWIPGLSVVATATDGEQPVGYALFTRCVIGEAPALCLGPCSVLPEYQRSGVGSAAIRFGLQAARDLGEEFVVVLGHPSYYPRFGFTRASRAGIRLSIEVPDEALMVLSLDATRTLPGGLVTYAPPFGI